MSILAVIFSPLILISIMSSSALGFEDCKLPKPLFTYALEWWGSGQVIEMKDIAYALPHNMRAKRILENAALEAGTVNFLFQPICESKAKAIRVRVENIEKIQVTRLEMLKEQQPIKTVLLSKSVLDAYSYWTGEQLAPKGVVEYTQNYVGFQVSDAKLATIERLSTLSLVREIQLTNPALLESDEAGISSEIADYALQTLMLYKMRTKMRIQRILNKACPSCF